MTSREKIIQELNQQPLSYEEAKAHSHHLDLLLGYQLESIESALIQRFPESQLVENVEIKQAWVGLNAQSLQTPYSEFVQMVQLMDPQKNELWIDLGAGYGRLGLILSFLRPEVCFRGYELVLERVLEGRRIYKLWNVNNS